MLISMVSTGLCIIGLVLIRGPMHWAFNSLRISAPSEISRERGTGVETGGHPHVGLDPFQRRKDLELAKALPSGFLSTGQRGGRLDSRPEPPRRPTRRGGGVEPQLDKRTRQGKNHDVHRRRVSPARKRRVRRRAQRPLLTVFRQVVFPLFSLHLLAPPFHAVPLCLEKLQKPVAVPVAH